MVFVPQAKYKYHLAVLERFRDVSVYRFSYVRALFGLGRLQFEEGEYTQARDTLRLAIKEVQAYAETNDRGRRFAFSLGPLNRTLVRVSTALGDHESARQALKQKETFQREKGPPPRRNHPPGPGRHRKPPRGPGPPRPMAFE